MREYNGFFPRRWWAMVVKEFVQLKRDRLTFAMIVGIPVVQLALFGFAINTDPKNMPLAVVGAALAFVGAVSALSITRAFGVIFLAKRRSRVVQDADLTAI